MNIKHLKINIMTKLEIISNNTRHTVIASNPYQVAFIYFQKLQNLWVDEFILDINYKSNWNNYFKPRSQSGNKGINSGAYLHREMENILGYKN